MGSERLRAAETPVVVGFEIVGTIVTVRFDETGPHVVIAQAPFPTTVLRAEPGVVLGLAAGVLSVEQAVDRGNLRGDVADLAAVRRWRPS